MHIGNIRGGVHDSCKVVLLNATLGCPTDGCSTLLRDGSTRVNGVDVVCLGSDEYLLSVSERAKRVEDPGNIGKEVLRR